MRILVTGGSGFIGTNYIGSLPEHLRAGCINVDYESPRNPAHKSYWRECDILDASRLREIVKDFAPTHVIHLAAKTGVDEKDLSDFAANTVGTTNLLRSVEGSSSRAALNAAPAGSFLLTRFFAYT